MDFVFIIKISLSFRSATTFISFNYKSVQSDQSPLVVLGTYTTKKGVGGTRQPPAVPKDRQPTPRQTSAGPRRTQARAARPNPEEVVWVPADV